jgi:hypothetical protein
MNDPLETMRRLLDPAGLLFVHERPLSAEDQRGLGRWIFAPGDLDPRTANVYVLLPLLHAARTTGSPGGIRCQTALVNRYPGAIEPNSVGVGPAPGCHKQALSRNFPLPPLNAHRHSDGASVSANAAYHGFCEDADALFTEYVCDRLSDLRLIRSVLCL